VPVADLVATLQQQPAVEFAEPNQRYHLAATPNDPYYTNGSLWGMQGTLTTPANRFGSRAADAWAFGFTGSRDVAVGLVDKGIQLTHPDLSGQVWTNPFDPPNGRDDDGNGYVDDTHGWDFADGDNTIYDGPFEDHGTHVAGTIGARGGNGLGVVGMNWHVSLIAAKAFDAAGTASTFELVQALDYLTDLRTRHFMLVVASNNSYTGGNSQALGGAAGRAARAGILLVAAAGNGGTDGVGDNLDLAPVYPASINTTATAGFDAVIAVAAIDRAGALAAFSNFGAASVHLGAPGVGIWSTVPPNSYALYDGTSMATPHVVGAAALYAARYPTAYPWQIRRALLKGAVATPSLRGKTTSGGRLNVVAALRSPPGGVLLDALWAGEP
jgi:subtilisin family serine protease